MTQPSIQEDMRGFAVRVFEQAGGLVDWPHADQPGTAVVNADVSALVQADETFTLDTQAVSEGLCVSLASDFLDVAGHVLDAKVPRVAGLTAPDRYLKRGDMQQAIDGVFTWHNARVRVLESRPVEVEYHTWWFFGTLRSDESWEHRLELTLNAESLSEVEIPNPLAMPDLQAHPDLTPVVPGTFDRASSLAKLHLIQKSAAFIGRMESRLDRDRRRLNSYYAALLRDTGSKKRRVSLPADPAEQQAKRRAVQLELRRKLVELEERYAMDALLQPLTLIRTQLPALAIDLTVRRKQAERIHTAYWNSLSKQFEPMLCSRCHRSSQSIAFTNDDVDVLCSNCHMGRAEKRPQPTQPR